MEQQTLEISTFIFNFIAYNFCRRHFFVEKQTRRKEENEERTKTDRQRERIDVMA